MGILDARGDEVTAITGRTTAADYLRELGPPSAVPHRAELGTRPLERAMVAGAVELWRRTDGVSCERRCRGEGGAQRLRWTNLSLP